MAAITESALQGEWFYLEEDAPLDRSTPEFFILQNGKVRASTKPDLVGDYAITDDGAVLTFARHAQSKLVIALRATGAAFDGATPTLQADATYEMEALEEPMSFYGAFIRRDANFLSAGDMGRKIA